MAARLPPAVHPTNADSAICNGNDFRALCADTGYPLKACLRVREMVGVCGCELLPSMRSSHPLKNPVESRLRRPLLST